VGDYLGKARAVTVEFCQAGDRTMAIVGWRSREGGVFFKYHLTDQHVKICWM